MKTASRLSYMLLGAAGGCVFGLLGLLRIRDADGPSIVAITAASGALLGLSLHATQSWSSQGPAGQLLRWIAGLSLAGLVLGTVVAATRAIPFAGVPTAIGVGLVAGLGFGIQEQQRTLFDAHEPDNRTARDVGRLWAVVILTLAVALGLFTLSWRLTS